MFDFLVLCTTRLHFPYTTVYPSLGNLDFFPHEEEVVLGGAAGGVTGMLRPKEGRQGEEDDEEDDEEDLEGEEEQLCAKWKGVIFG